MYLLKFGSLCEIDTVLIFFPLLYCSPSESETINKVKNGPAIANAIRVHLHMTVDVSFVDNESHQSHWTAERGRWLEKFEWTF